MSIKVWRWPKWTTCSTITWCHLISSYCSDRCVPLEIPQISAFRDIDLKKPWLFFLYWYFFRWTSLLLLVDNQTSKSMSWWATNWSLSQSNNYMLFSSFFLLNPSVKYEIGSLLTLFDLSVPGSVSFTGENKSSKIKGPLAAVQWDFSYIDLLCCRDSDTKQGETEAVGHLKHPTKIFPFSEF